MDIANDVQQGQGVTPRGEVRLDRVLHHQRPMLLPPVEMTTLQPPLRSELSLTVGLVRAMHGGKSM
jgi:hypothetical protein